MKILTVDQVIELHSRLIQSTGGLERSARLGLPLKKVMINGKN